MRKRIQYSQNFLKDKALIRNLLDKSSIRAKDLVYDIGAGQGIITDELIRKQAKVISFEIDSNLYNKLKEKYQNNPSIQLINGDFLSSTLPNRQYKIFSNIPFNITSAIVKKLVFDRNPPEEAYLIIQKEAAKKFMGKPLDKSNSLLSILIQCIFDLTIFHEFKRSDFFPTPNVDVVMLKIKHLEQPHVVEKDKDMFYDFVTFAFNQFEPNILQGLKKVLTKQVIIRVSKEYTFSVSSKPSELDFKHWLALFQAFKGSPNKDKVYGSFNKLQKEQQGLQKIHRTRLDRNWRSN